MGENFFFIYHFINLVEVITLVLVFTKTDLMFCFGRTLNILFEL